MIYCRTLGPVELTVDGEPPPAELLWRKPLALLIYLARSPSRTRPRRHLAALLWGDRPDGDARHSLNEALRLLRRVAVQGLESDGELIRLAEDTVRLDVQDFESLAAERRWVEAASLVRSEFLQGFGIAKATAFEDWLAAERSGWGSRSVRVLVAASESLMAQGHVDAAAARAHLALHLDPDSAEAAESLRRAQALGGAPVPSPDDADPERVRRPRLVGRERQLESLLRTWRDASTLRRPALAIVGGDSGSGKSRLLEELEARVRHDRGAVASVRAIPSDARSPGETLRAILRGELSRLPGLAAADPAALAAVIAVDPRSRERFAGAVVVAALPPASAIRELLRVVAEEQPLLVVVDDAHYADAESIDALGGCLRELADAPLLIALSAELQLPVQGLDALRTRLGRDVAGTAVRLHALGDRHLNELTGWAFPSWKPEDRARLARRLAQDSGGLPLYAVELLHAVALGYRLGSDGSPWPAPDRTLDHTLPGSVPESMVAAIRMNFRRLSADAQAVLAAAATLEERCRPDRLARAAGLDPVRADAALDELEWHRWLAAEPRGYAFVARILRQLVASELTTPGQRRRILNRGGPVPTSENPI